LVVVSGFELVSAPEIFPRERWEHGTRKNATSYGRRGGSGRSLRHSWPRRIPVPPRTFGCVLTITAERQKRPAVSQLVRGRHAIYQNITRRLAIRQCCALADLYLFGKYDFVGPEHAFWWSPLKHDAHMYLTGGRIGWPESQFDQFVRAKERWVSEPIEPQARYSFNAHTGNTPKLFDLTLLNDHTRRVPNDDRWI